MYPTGVLRYNPRREIAVVEPGMRQIPSLDGSRTASRRLLGVVWKPVGSRAKRLPGIESS